MRDEAVVVGEGVAALKEARHPNTARESRMRTLLLAFLAGSAGLFIVWVVVFLGRPALLSAQTLHYAKSPDAENGEKVYKGGCIACHGSEGKGAPMASTVFTRPDTFPDFTDCAGSTPEPNGNWKAVIVHGGPSRGLSQIMPAFGDLLTDEEINDVIAYMRGFCKNVHHDPLGELNLPRALVTEKAFPENEIVISTAASASGAPAWTTDIIDERTIIDARTQLETDVPVNYADQAHNWTEGFGDITRGLKREMFSSKHRFWKLPVGATTSGSGWIVPNDPPAAAMNRIQPRHSSCRQYLATLRLFWLMLMESPATPSPVPDAIAHRVKR
jgi:mono/diheme cytochrome c family protein